MLIHVYISYIILYHLDYIIVVNPKPFSDHLEKNQGQPSRRSGVSELDLQSKKNSRILKWGYCTICLALFSGDIPLHRPYMGLVYGRYLQFRFLRWPLIQCVKTGEHNMGFSVWLRRRTRCFTGK